MRIGVKSILEHKNACGKVSAKFLPILSVIDPKSPPFSVQKGGLAVAHIGICANIIVVLLDREHAECV